MPVTVRGIEFRYDTIINTVAIVLVFVLCTNYSNCQMRKNASETHRLIRQTNSLLSENLASGKREDELIEERLHLIESRMSDTISGIREDHDLLVKVQNQLDSDEAKRKKAAKGGQAPK